MKLNPKFLTHVTKGEHYMISTSDTKFKGIVKNNETAAFIVECLKSDTTESAIVDKLLTEYKGAYIDASVRHSIMVSANDNH